MAKNKVEDRYTSGHVGPKLPGLGRLPNKQFFKISEIGKFEKYASVKTLALLAN